MDRKKRNGILLAVGIIVLAVLVLAAVFLAGVVFAVAAARRGLAREK